MLWLHGAKFTQVILPLTMKLPKLITLSFSNNLFETIISDIEWQKMRNCIIAYAEYTFSWNVNWHWIEGSYQKPIFWSYELNILANVSEIQSVPMKSGPSRENSRIRTCFCPIKTQNMSCDYWDTPLLHLLIFMFDKLEFNQKILIIRVAGFRVTESTNSIKSHQSLNNKHSSIIFE